jgi:uncharacterized membrane protein
MFSIKQSIKTSWEKFKIEAGLCVLATLLMLIISSVGGGREGHYGTFLFTIAAMIFSLIIKIGYTKIFLRINDGEKPKFLEIFNEYKLFWKYLGASILFALVTVGGLIILIIPGIFLAIRFSFAPLIVVDTKTDPIKAMKESYAITKDSFWKLLGFFLIMMVFNLLGLVLFGIGLLITIPVTTFASIYIYRELSKTKASLTTQTDLTTASPQTV